VNGYARSLEHDLEEAMGLAWQSHHALTQCEASLAASWETINQERLEHRESQEALTFEREMHKETIELLEQVFQEAVRSGEIADSLSSQVAALQAASNSGIVVPQAMASMKAPLGEENSIPSPETCASSLSIPKHAGQDERQQVARPVNVDPSEGPEDKCYFPLHDVPLESTETQSSVTRSASAIEGADGHKRSKASSVAKKRTRRPAAGEHRLN
jgi:hypothetical protein